MIVVIVQWNHIRISLLETIPDSNTTLTETLNDDIVINSVTVENNNDIDAI